MTDDRNRMDLAQRRKQEIIGAARKVFAKVGYRRAQVEDIADILGIGKGTIYRYFGSKKKLFLAVANAVMVELGAAIATEARRVEDPFEKIAAAIRAQLDFIDRNSDVIEIMMQERAEFRNEFKPTYLAHRDANQKHLENVLRDAIAKGLMRNVDVRRVASLMGDFIVGIIAVGYTRKDRRLARTTGNITDLLFHGLLAKPGQTNAPRSIPPRAARKHAQKT